MRPRNQGAAATYARARARLLADTVEALVHNIGRADQAEEERDELQQIIDGVEGVMQAGCIAALPDDVARLRQERDEARVELECAQAFYRVAVSERDHARAEVERLRRIMWLSAMTAGCCPSTKPPSCEKLLAEVTHDPQTLE